MKFVNLLKIALKALNNNKLRCFLTMLGIIIGVASVITMLAIGQGSKNSIKAQISEMGSNMIMIHPGNMQRGGVRQSADDMQTIKVEDYESLRDLPGIAAISPSVNSGGQFVNGNNNYPSTVYGITPEYLDIRKLKVKDGTIFTDQDIKSAAKVCVLGKTVVDNLFPDGQDPIGKVVRFGKIPMTVIGVLESKGTNSMGQDQDDVVLAPYTTVMKRILAIDYLQGLFASAVDEEHTDETIEAITEVLRENHRLKEGVDDDF
ncbi:MAG: ABC transporter permease, partial [Duncaniella sp.]|nr:ABC transporter permease [Duncaniella sp.]